MRTPEPGEIKVVERAEGIEIGRVVAGVEGACQSLLGQKSADGGALVGL